MQGEKIKKISYRINSRNKLVVTFPDKKSKSLNGGIKIDRDNDLVYIINESDEWHRKYGIPDKLYFKGKWELDEKHNLVLVFRGKDRLTLRGVITNASQDSLIFKIKSYPEPKKSKISFLRLKGSWNCDKFNRIVFEVKKEHTIDKLTLVNVWNITKDNQIIYEYRRLKTKRKTKILFKGYWQLYKKNRLRYVIGSITDRAHWDTKSYLNMSVYLEKPNVYPARGKIKYRIGIGLKDKREDRILTLSGVWKIDREVGLIYEVDYGEDRVKRYKFSAELRVAKKDKLIFDIYTNRNVPLGISVTFLKHHPQISNKDFEYLFRLKRLGKEVSIQVGGRIRF